MPYIVVDTCVLIRLENKYSKTKQCILSNDDVIAISDKAVNEYEARAYASELLLQSFLQEFEGKKKLKRFKKSFVEARVNRLENCREIKYPNHSSDKKWVRLAIASGATYIVTTNGHLLKLPPNPCNDHCVEAIDPSKYVDVRCPNIV